MELEAGRMSAVAYQAGTIALVVVGSACVVGSAVVAAKRRQADRLGMGTPKYSCGLGKEPLV